MLRPVLDQKVVSQISLRLQWTRSVISSFVADDKLSKLASGEDTDLHGTMIALEEADITLRTMVAVRDKVVGAYQEIMNMSI